MVLSSLSRAGVETGKPARATSETRPLQRAQAATSPPLPCFVYRVAITGHRNQRLAPERIDGIRRDLADVFSRIENAAGRARETAGNLYAPGPPRLHLVSSLADGADTLAAAIALAAGWSLDCPIPFPRHEYETDFAADEQPLLHDLLLRAEAVLELDGDRLGDVDAAYFAAGRVALDHADLVIAIWDGEAARGVGGTAMVVDAALEHGLQVIWIDALGRQPPCVLFARSTAEPLSALERIVASQTAAPVQAQAERAADFFAEHQRRTRYGLGYLLFGAAIEGRWPHQAAHRRLAYVERTEAEWCVGRNGRLPRPHDRLMRILLPRYAWADNLASFYGELHRSSYATNYVLSAAAVLLALLETGLGWSKPAAIAAESVMAFIILANTFAARRYRWHARWLDYRHLAERLRHERFLFAVSGRVPQPPRTTEETEATWVAWYHAATLRELGLVSARMDVKHLIWLRDDFVRRELTPQIAYHQHVQQRAERNEHRLRWLGTFAFAATFCTCIAYLLLVGLGSIDPLGADAAARAKPWVAVLTGFLPALGGAVFGLRVQGEFALCAERSRRAATQLQQLREEVDRRAPEALTVAELRSFHEAAAAMMTSEAADWRIVVSRRPISLPT